MKVKPAARVPFRGALTTVTALWISVTGFFAIPAQASAPPNGEYSCSTGTIAGPSPKYTLTNSGAVAEVTAGSDCVAAVVIPPGVTSIGGSAFEGGSLVSISIPNSVISIGNNAFDSSELESITIADRSALQSIGVEAFLFSKVQRIDLSATTSLISIGASAFLRASELESIILPNSVTSIGARAFEGSGLTSIVIPNRITSIESETFKSAGDLTSVTIPDSVTSIGVRVFSGSGITSIVIPNSITSIENGTFGNAQELASVTIPSSVTSIAGEAFGGTSSLRSITIPASVNSIGAEAFTNAINLASIYFLGNAPTIDEYGDTFANLPVSARAYIQPSATGFRPVGDLWNGLIVTYTPVYSVTYDTQGGSAVTAGSYTMASSVTLPTAPTRSGFTFAGWFTATTGGTALGTSYSPPSTGNITLYAQWNPVAPTIAPVTAPAATTAPSPTTAPVAKLATTGANLEWLFVAGLLSVMAGFGFLAFIRRKRIW
jgi:uncharacterized repeat protein (TIGR02543 family)/LPXTG-motif cell wall-anchored protein